MQKKKYLKDNKELMKEYDFNKNTDIDLETITEGMGLSIWWKCSKCSHEWKTRVNHRTKDGTGCPVCRKQETILKQQEEVKRRLKTENITITYPDIAKEWNYEKNISLKPENYLPGMGDSVWWKCSKCSHEWKTRINHRTKDGNNCPICSRKENYNKMLEEKGSLALNHPELLDEWNYNKNDTDPNMILDGSNLSVWWTCKKCGHEWKARISQRAKKNTGCPKCGQEQGKKTLLNELIFEKGSLAETNPELAKEWNFKKNKNITPYMVMERSPKKVWWICNKCGYEWQMNLYNRSKGGHCPKCLRIEKSIAKATPIIGVNDLLSQKPDLCREWHPTKNEITPENITVSSNKKVWWLGKCGHEWQATVGSRTSGRGCPICLKEYKISYPEKIIYFYLKKSLYNLEVLENYHPDFLKQKEYDIAIPSIRIGIEYDGYNWHKSYQRDKEKDIISKENNYKVIRIREKKCEKYDSSSIKIYYNEKESKNLKEVILKVLNIVSKITQMNYNLDFDLERDNISILELLEMHKKENSIANLFPNIIKEWHPTKNGSLKPEYISAHTHKKMWWICSKGHEYQMVVKHKTEDNCGCPICSNHKILSGFNDLETLRPDIAKEWDYGKNKPLTPDKVAVSANYKVWWLCPKGHSYYYSISHRTCSGRTCPICSNRQLLLGYNDLVTVNKEIAKEWDYEKNKGMKPEDFTPISGTRVWWKCSKCGYEWNIKISNRYIKGNGCPKCAGNKRWETRKKLNTIK